ncbi:hypothetical protein ABZ547_26440 [Streptomyces sparsogenes]
MNDSSAGTQGVDKAVFTARSGRLAALPRLLSLDQSGELTSAHVKLVATAVGRSERAVWRWVATARATGRVDAASRTRFSVTPEIRRLLVLWGGNASAVHRELKQRALADPRLPAAPSLSTIHRALRRDLTLGERAGLAKGEAARRAFDVFAQRPSRAPQRRLGGRPQVCARAGAARRAARAALGDLVHRLPHQSHHGGGRDASCAQRGCGAGGPADGP